MARRDYLRLHGRNTETWDDKVARVASDRFNYDYSDDELASLAPHIHALAEQALMVQAIFNNNYEEQGQRNARRWSGSLRVPYRKGWLE